MHRKLLTPTFHFKILENSIEIIHRNVSILKTILDEKVDSEEFDIHTLIEKCSLDIIIGKKKLSFSFQRYMK